MVLCFHAASERWEHALSLAPSQIVVHVESVLDEGLQPAGLFDAAHDPRALHVTFDDAFRSATAVLPALERLRVPVTIFVCPTLADSGAALEVRELAAEPLEERRTLSWDELRDLAERGVAIESHTLTHPHLPELDDQELRRELGDSKDRIEQELMRPCRFLAYPFGDHDERVRAAAMQAGYEAAFAVDDTAIDGNTFALSRTGVYRRSSQDSPAVMEKPR